MVWFQVMSILKTYCTYLSRSSAELLLKYDASTNIPDNSGKHKLLITVVTSIVFVRVMLN